MTTLNRPNSRSIAAAAWRIALVVALLGGGLALATILLPVSSDPSDVGTLSARIAVGIAISTATLCVIALLVRRADHQRMSDVGFTSVRTGWRLAVWGVIVWTVPAAATFGVLALLGAPLSITVAGPELARTVVLLLLAVFLAEALCEEAVFRGYITAVLGTLTRGWSVIVIQALLFTVFAALLRQNANPADLSLFLAMGIGFGYLRMVTGSVWMPIGFHVAFQTGAQLILTHAAVEFGGSTTAAMLALGVIPFSFAAILVSSSGIPRIVHPG